MRTQTILILLGACSVAAACGVESQTKPTGGIELDGAGGDGGEAEQGTIRGFAVVGSDYNSANISLLSADGELESASFISSGSESPGLSAAVSGDVSLPSMAVAGDELIVIDRFPAAVLTWVDLRTAEVRAQLSVATGFASNPHDYVPYTRTKAFVPRFEPNLASGKEPFDQGNDVLIVNPISAEITDRIDLTAALADAPGGFYPRADRAFMAGGKLRVFALGFNADYTARLDSRLITIDPETHAIDDVLVFEGMISCGNASVSPGGTEMAVACNGAYGQDPALGFPDSGVLIVTVADHPEETARWTSNALGVDQATDVAWLSDDHVALLTSGRYSPDLSRVEANDSARTLNVRDGSLSEPWLETAPFNLGDVACSLEHGVCLVADAETDGGVVHALSIGEGAEVTLTGQIKPDEASGLPPRSIGNF